MRRWHEVLRTCIKLYVGDTSTLVYIFITHREVLPSITLYFY
jgi:hypothetical protein